MAVSASMRKTNKSRRTGRHGERGGEREENFHCYLSVISTGLLLFCRRRATGDLASSTISIPADLRLRHDSDIDLHVCVTDMSCKATRCGSTSCVLAVVAEILLSTMTVLSSLVPERQTKS